MRRTRIAPAAMILVALALVGCGGEEEGAAAGGEGGELTLTLAAQNGSGQSGTATLAPAGEGKTRIVVELSNPPAEPQPSHVHSGTCADIGGVVEPLESVVDGRAESVVPMSLDDLRRGGLIVHAHKSAAESKVSVACAAIPKASGTSSGSYGY